MCGYKTLPWNLFMHWLSVSVQLEEYEAYRTAGPSTLTELGIIKAVYLPSPCSKIALREEYRENLFIHKAVGSAKLISELPDHESAR
jgi:hypothetical protein